jgi:tRNA (guanine-N7-)-methyltransferase
MARRLKYDIPGPDWRVRPDEISADGLAKLFAPDLAPPLHLVVDLGFGRGEFLQELAAREPGTAFLGVEYSFKRVLKLARRLARGPLRNVRLVEATAEQVVQDRLPHACVAAFWINFPDPWPKKRHHGRRLIQPRFVHELALRLVPAGLVSVTTDHVEYAEQIAAVLAGEPLLENRFAPERFRREADDRPATAYQLEWRAEGRPLHFFCHARRADATPAAG